MKIGYKILICVFGILLMTIGIILVNYTLSSSPDVSTIKHIRETIKNDDIAGEIGVSSADDIGFYVKGEYNILIYYGRQTINVTRKAFFSKEYREELSTIGIEIQYRVDEETGEILYRVLYRGTPVDQYSYVTG